MSTFEELRVIIYNYYNPIPARDPNLEGLFGMAYGDYPLYGSLKDLSQSMVNFAGNFISGFNFGYNLPSGGGKDPYYSPDLSKLSEEELRNAMTQYSGEGLSREALYYIYNYSEDILYRLNHIETTYMQ